MHLKNSVEEERRCAATNGPGVFVGRNYAPMVQSRPRTFLALLKELSPSLPSLQSAALPVVRVSAPAVVNRPINPATVRSTTSTIQTPASPRKRSSGTKVRSSPSEPKGPTWRAMKRARDLEISMEDDPTLHRNKQARTSANISPASGLIGTKRTSAAVKLGGNAVTGRTGGIKKAQPSQKDFTVCSVPSHTAHEGWSSASTIGNRAKSQKTRTQVALSSAGPSKLTRSLNPGAMTRIQQERATGGEDRTTASGEGGLAKSVVDTAAGGYDAGDVGHEAIARKRGHVSCNVAPQLQHESKVMTPNPETRYEPASTPQDVSQRNEAPEDAQRNKENTPKEQSSHPIDSRSSVSAVIPPNLYYPRNEPGAVPLTGSDFERLLSGRMLSDNLVEFGLRLWYDKLQKEKPALASQVEILSPFFFEKLCESHGHEKALKYLKKADIFSKRFVVVPIFEREERHFYLAIIVSPGALMKRPTNASGVLYSVDHRVEQIGWIRPAEEVPQVDGHPNLWLDKVRLVDMEVTYSTQILILDSLNCTRVQSEEHYREEIENRNSRKSRTTAGVTESLVTQMADDDFESYFQIRKDPAGATESPVTDLAVDFESYWLSRKDPAGRLSAFLLLQARKRTGRPPNMYPKLTQVTVPSQQGLDCGLHVIHNAAAFIEHSAARIMSIQTGKDSRLSDEQLKLSWGTSAVASMRQTFHSKILELALAECGSRLDCESNTGSASGSGSSHPATGSDDQLEIGVGDTNSDVHSS